MPNRLAQERSPYLLQHANNPVDWYPWGDAAFERARVEDKPIFLSIGYSTCHWCHVMEHESFEDEGVADALNRHFVSIKVDREERPDIDRVYMAFVQVTTGAGGWPMSVFLTANRQPFFGGTYFPPDNRYGRPGFPTVLAEIARAWRDERPRLLESAASIVERLRQVTSGESDGAVRAPVAGRDAIDTGIAAFASAFDGRHGGFGGAPKFPRPSEQYFLLVSQAFTGDHRARQMALETLRAMAEGGVRDQIGGGFHRYSVDAEWRVPHFEKMLYDQAQLALAYLDAAQVTAEPFYAAVAEDTLAYVLRDLTGPDGAFYSAEDADSVPPDADVAAAGGHPPKREGAFYVWTSEEIDGLFGDDAAIVRRRFGVEERGNAPADPQGEFIGQNILYLAQSVNDIAVRANRSAEAVEGVLARARSVLFEARGARPRPHKDDKVITAWNGLMIAAYARAARTLVDSPRREEWRRAALRAAEAVERLMWRPGERRLYRRYRDGESAVNAFCEDYACLAWGLLELFQATGHPHWLEWAIDLTDVQTSLFWDERGGGWFSTTGDDPSVLLRLKEDYDGAEPAASSVTVLNLLTLGHLLADAPMRDLAQRTLERYGPQLGNVARVMPFMVSNVARWHGRAAQIVIVGDPAAPDTRALERTVAGRYLPNAVVVPLVSGAPPPATDPRLSWLRAMTARDGRATAYVCQDFACRAPVSDPAALDEQLRDVGEPWRVRVG